MPDTAAQTDQRTTATGKHLPPIPPLPSYQEQQAEMFRRRRIKRHG